jgi:hypothetical protein
MFFFSPQGDNQFNSEGKQKQNFQFPVNLGEGDYRDLVLG